MKTILTLTIIFLLLLSIQARAQKTILRFDSTEHDFGKVMVEDGPVTYKFQFTNTSSSSVKIINVKTVCVCTTSDWSTDSIKPGATGFINATYNVRYRLGQFVKPLYIFCNAKRDSIVLKIKGDVTKGAMTLQDSFPYELGNLRFKDIQIGFNKLSNKLKDTSTSILMLNPSDTAITIIGFDNNGKDFLFLKDLPITLLPHTKLFLPIFYNPGKVNNYGYVSNKLVILTSDTKMPRKAVYISAYIHQYVPIMTADEVSNAPRLKFREKTFDFGDIKLGEAKSTSFFFMNVGKTKLKIYEIKGNYGCVITPLSKTEIAPGDSGTIDIKFNSNNKKGSHVKPIIVYSNDPLHPECVLRVKANVVVN